MGKTKIEKFIPEEGGTLGVTEINEEGGGLVAVQGDLFNETDTEEQIELLKALALSNVLLLLDEYLKFKEEVEFATPQFSPILRKTYNVEDINSIIDNLVKIREGLLNPKEEYFLPGKREKYYAWIRLVHKETLNFIDEYNEKEAQKDKDYKILTDPITKERRVLQFKSENATLTKDPLTDIGEKTSTIDRAYQEIRKISERPHPSNIRISKDLMETQIRSVGDTLEYLTPEDKAQVHKYQEKGKLLAGSLEGLSGGSAYLKSFTIALAQTLNEQSKYYQTEEDYSGVPENLIPDMFGEGVEVASKEKEITQVVKRGQKIEILKETRKYPLILVSYEDLASKMRGRGKQKGGKDSEYIREYIDKLSGKQYLFDGGRDPKSGGKYFYGLPFLQREIFIYRGSKEVGCLLRLTPQFSKTLRGYTSLRSDTIQLLGGGNQKEITMALLDLLLYVRGAGGGYTWKKNKEELLSAVGGGKTYSGRPGKRETDFQNAVKKIKDTELITDYKEETSPSGDKISVFKFNPDYSKERD